MKMDKVAQKMADINIPTPVEIKVEHNLKCVICAVNNDKITPAAYIVPRNHVYNGITTASKKMIFHTDLTCVCQEHLSLWYNTDCRSHEDIPPLKLSGEM